MPEFDVRRYPYASRRNVVFARKAMACTSIPQGAQIGLDVMKAGGNAVDAAVAMAAAMPLLEPTSNGLGSDCFALVWIEREKKLYGLNASGTAPAALDGEMVRAMGFFEMPKAGWIPTMVPGAPAGWAELNRRFGSKPLAELFAPAIAGAREGVPVAVNLEPMWVEDSWRIKGFARLEGRCLLVDCVGPAVRISDTNIETEQENRLVLLAGPGMPLRRAVKQAIQWYPGLIREVWE